MKDPKETLRQALSEMRAQIAELQQVADGLEKLIGVNSPGAPARSEKGRPQPLDTGRAVRVTKEILRERGKPLQMNQILDAIERRGYYFRDRRVFYSVLYAGLKRRKEFAFKKGGTFGLTEWGPVRTPVVGEHGDQD